MDFKVFKTAKPFDTLSEHSQYGNLALELINNPRKLNQITLSIIVLFNANQDIFAIYMIMSNF